MSDNSSIEWTGKTWNFLIGCDKVSAGCKNCYAIHTAWIRLHNPLMAGIFDGTVEKTASGARNWTGQINVIEDRMLLPFSWKKPDFVFVNSMSDLFHESVPDAVLDRAFAVMALTDHTYQVLTKRAKRMEAYFAKPCTIANIMHEMDKVLFGKKSGAILKKAFHAKAQMLEGGAIPNVWLGVSVEDQKAADARIPHLLRTPAAVRFLSCEPLLGPVDVSRWLKIDWQCSGCRGYFGGDYNEACPDCGRTGYWCGSHKFNARKMPEGRLFPYQAGIAIDWVICGGESGPGARPMHPDWARTLRDQCAAAGVDFFFKQWGNWAERDFRAARRKHTFTAHPGQAYCDMYNVGKKVAGRRLDGVEHNAMPAAYHIKSATA
ncbi:phage Gp37/Gp68 family protein [Flaviaesturariibacter amylovorans]|uniref:Phage Gp37/Gp68 family protein n=1 Tax=Flaviaesturariibacter amylovorans TaxID=1084520 RepID=A0ABP8GQB3_9BACT